MNNDWTLLAQGAEAKVYLAPAFTPGHAVSIVKDRLVKRYRHPELDKKLSRKRFRGEVKAMKRAAELASTAQVAFTVPQVQLVDEKLQRIAMEFVEGQTTKLFFDEHDGDGKDDDDDDGPRRRVAGMIGRAVASLHANGLVHGDLTTSNLMLPKTTTSTNTDTATTTINSSQEGGVLTVIDFGLAFFTKSVDDFAVDLYVLERAFLSTHPNSEHLFQVVLDSYVEAANDASSSSSSLDAAGGGGMLGAKVRDQFLEVQQRGRKKLAFG